MSLFQGQQGQEGPIPQSSVPAPISSIGEQDWPHISSL